MFMALVDPNNPNDHTYEPRIGRSVSLDHAAQLLCVSRRTIFNRIRDGRLQTIRTLGGSQRVLVESLLLLPVSKKPHPSSEPPPASAAEVGDISAHPLMIPSVDRRDKDAKRQEVQRLV